MTGFDPLEIEEEVREFWQENDVRSRVRESTEGNEPFFMIDGPPYLNGPPHVGHMQGKVLKDVMLRYRQMQGYDVWDQAGFDTHGLPNELATEEELGIEDKNEIGSSISAEEFIRNCRERATSAQDLWRDVMRQLAIWQDFENPYLTFDSDYIESEWWLVSEVEEQDLLYRDHKPIHWCPRCQTSLSGYEVTDEYREVEDRAVYVKLPLEDREEKLVIWTTTPWTVPANMAVFVHPDVVYAVVEADGERLVVAEELAGEVMEKAGVDDYEVVRTLSGSDLESMAYSHPLEERLPGLQELSDHRNVQRVHTSERLVTLEEGTGLVHAASGHGLEDYEETRRFDIQVFSPVDEEGRYTEEVGEYEGEYVHEVDERIASDLEEKGVLLAEEIYPHEYPHCWRCKTELVYRAAKQWFIRNEEVKRRMLEENEEVNWIPEVARKRFRNFVEDSPDWCISRQNYWGVPLPIWECSGCDRYEVVGSFDRLEELAGGLPEDFDPHKHHVDPLDWECGECGGRMERVDDVLDVWFDSGCAPFASLHYPFEEEPLESMWPMDFITEASDQIRGWFYSLLFCGILGFDEKPYDTVLFQGHVLDAEGRKMSKSLGNVIDPEEQVEEYGADLPRFYSLRVAPAWEQTKYDEDEIEQEIYRFFNVLWNVREFHGKHGSVTEGRPELEVEDRWIISRLNSLLLEAGHDMESCEFHQLARSIEDFVLEDLSRWYLKRVRERMKDGSEAASWTLHEVLKKVSRLLAPFSPHLAERLYQDLGGEEFSVHAASYPEPDGEMRDEELEEAMELARDLVESCVRIRDRNGYNLRWPARKLNVSTSREDELEPLVPLVEDMVNVREVEFGEVESTLEAEPDYSSLGPKFGDEADRVAELIGEMESEQVEQLEDTGEVKLDGFEVSRSDVKVSSHTVGEVNRGDFEGGELFLDLEMTDEIEEEAFFSEFVRSVQQARKEAGLDVEDEVELALWGDTEPVESREERLGRRVNLASVEYGKDSELSYQGEVEFRGRNLEFSFSEPVD